MLYAGEMLLALVGSFAVMLLPYAAFHGAIYLGRKMAARWPTRDNDVI